MMEEQQITFQKYRTIDLAIFALLLVVFEGICVFAAKLFKNELYTISITCAIVAIVMMRWSGFAIIHAILGGFVFAGMIFLTGKSTVSLEKCLVYGIGNALPVIIIAPFLKKLNKQKIRDSWLLSFVYVLAVYLLMNFGRALVALAFGNSLKLFLTFTMTDCISLLFSVLAILIIRRIDGMFEDQKHYLFRLEKTKNSADEYNGRIKEAKSTIESDLKTLKNDDNEQENNNQY